MAVKILLLYVCNVYIYLNKSAVLKSVYIFLNFAPENKPVLANDSTEIKVRPRISGV